MPSQLNGECKWLQTKLWGRDKRTHPWTPTASDKLPNFLFPEGLSWQQHCQGSREGTKSWLRVSVCTWRGNTSAPISATCQFPETNNQSCPPGCVLWKQNQLCVFITVIKMSSGCISFPNKVFSSQGQHPGILLLLLAAGSLWAQEPLRRILGPRGQGLVTPAPGWPWRASMKPQHSNVPAGVLILSFP